jgi:hypothetical protein
MDSESSPVMQAQAPRAPGSWLKDHAEVLVAIIILVGGFLYLFVGPKEDRAAVITMMTVVGTYYFGSSSGSNLKNGIIAQLKSKNNG